MAGIKTGVDTTKAMRLAGVLLGGTEQHIKAAWLVQMRQTASLAKSERDERALQDLPPVTEAPPEWQSHAHSGASRVGWLLVTPA